MKFITVALLVTSLFMAGCASVEPRPQPQGFAQYDEESELPEDHIILVGEVVLDPKIDKWEQNADYRNDINDVIRDSAFLLLADDRDANQQEITRNYIDHRVDADLGETFYAVIPRSHIHLLDMSYAARIDSRNAYSQVVFGVEHRNYEAKATFDIPDDADAIYIGKLIVHRDEFNIASKIETVDEYRKVKREFRKRFGRDIKLKKSLVAVYVN